MNLWDLFPDSLLMCNGILKLPYLAILFYLYIVYATFKNAAERKYLMMFLMLSLVASIIMIINLGPPVAKIIPPLSLLTVMVMPLVMLIINLHNRAYNLVLIWFMGTIAGWLHALSWSVWLFVLAAS